MKYQLSAYADPTSEAQVFRLRALPEFSPLDVNVAFLAQIGWNQSVDRLRFHLRRAPPIAPDDPLAVAVTRFEPHLLIRRLDRDEDCFASVHAYVDGDIVVLSNDADFAQLLFQGISLECPPSFHTLEEFEVTEEWLADEETKALFAGMLAGAQGCSTSFSGSASVCADAGWQRMTASKTKPTRRTNGLPDPQDMTHFSRSRWVPSPFYNREKIHARPKIMIAMITQNCDLEDHGRATAVLCDRQ